MTISRDEQRVDDNQDALLARDPTDLLHALQIWTNTERLHHQTRGNATVEANEQSVALAWLSKILPPGTDLF